MRRIVPLIFCIACVAQPQVGARADAFSRELQARRAAHWAWQPVRDVPPGPVKDAAWASDPIDRYILSKLEANGLAPAPAADRRTLIRRAAFDLTGLPPAPEAVEAFVSDPAPDAFEKVVDGLLASPHFGERWARHWLDLVRYAETYGHEFDYPVPYPTEYLYYVVRAFNADVPYDCFVAEHIAGDLLPAPRLHPTERFDESVIATGFWFFHEQTHAPVDVRQHQSDRIENQIDVFGKAFQATTIACARCHDHKFDAVSAADYYALYGVLESTRQQAAYLDPGGKIAAAVRELEAARKVGNDAMSTTPRIMRPVPRYSGKFVRFESFDRGDFGHWSATGHAFGARPTAEGEWDSFKRGPRPAPAGVAHSGLLAAQLQGTLRSRSFVIDMPHIDFLLAGHKGQVRLVVDGYTMNSFNGLLFEGLKFDVNTDGAFRWHRQDVSRYKGHRAHIEILDDARDGFVAVDEIAFVDGSSPSPAVPDDPPAYDGLASSPELTSAAQRLDEIAATIPAPMRALAAIDGDGVDSPVFRRGSHKSLGEVVPRRYLEAIAPAPFTANGSGRLELARCVASADNPLTARVMANRVWHHLFGRGIVPTVDDFGVMGEPPSHPELLDHLADRFVREGWSVKRLIRAIVLSSTYRMSSVADDRATQVDPENVLLHHKPLRRLEGEAIRDAMLAVSGRLDRTVRAPVVEIHLTDFLTGLGRPKEGGPLDGHGRRSLYTKVRRNFLPPMMLAFDTPIPFSAIGRRNVSNVPAQALILMNDPFVIQQAQVWAEATLREPGLTSVQRIDRMYRQAFARPATEPEVRDGLAFLREQADEHGAGADDVKAWADFAHVLFNVKEFIYVK